jgi:O-antigen/teichoic acid export membrane protein
MSYTRKVAFNTAAQFIGKIAALALSLITIAILFRFLGVEGVGKYTTTFSFVAFFTLFSDIGLGWTMLRELSVGEDKSKIFRNIYTLRFMLGILVFIVASAIVWVFKYPVDVKWAVMILSFAFFFQVMISSVVQVYLNFYRMDIAVAAEVVGKAIILLGVYLTSTRGGSLNSVMFSYVAGSLVNFFIVWFMAKRFLNVGMSFDYGYWKKVVRQALPIGITLVFGFIYYKVDSLMLSLMKDMTDVGIYGAAYKILEVLQIFPALFLGASFSLVTKYVTSKDERVHSAFQKEFDFLVLLGIPVVVGTFILSRQIIAFIAGSSGDFVDISTVSFFGIGITSAICLQILIFSVGFNFITSLYSFMIVSLGKQKQMVYPTIGFAVFNIILNLILIPRYSYLGATIATLVTELIVLFATRYIVNKNIELKVQYDKFLKIVAMGLVMGLSTFVFKYLGLELLLNLLFSIIIYGVLAVLFQVIPKDTIQKIIKLKTN